MLVSGIQAKNNLAVENVYCSALCFWDEAIFVSKDITLCAYIWENQRNNQICLLIVYGF